MPESIFDFMLGPIPMPVLSCWLLFNYFIWGRLLVSPAPDTGEGRMVARSGISIKRANTANQFIVRDCTIDISCTPLF